MISFHLAFLALLCVSASADKVELPPMPDFSKLSYEELLEKASSFPGLEFLKDNGTRAPIDITSSRIHPDVLEDSMLLTVIIIICLCKVYIKINRKIS